MEILLGAIATTVGAAVLFGLSEAVTAVRAKGNAAKAMRVAAFACLDRLQKIHRAKAAGDEEQQIAEAYRLGPDLDRWRDCIAASADPRDHWHAYEAMMPILLGHEFERLDQAINTMRQLVGLNDRS